MNVKATTSAKQQIKAHTICAGHAETAVTQYDALSVYSAVVRQEVAVPIMALRHGLLP
jgi:hypothetical protein